ncbi:hypothetical protein QA860_07425 [Streptomyces stelliscabiei]
MTVRTPTLPSPVTSVAGPVALPGRTGPFDPSAIEEHQEHRV